MAFDLALLKKHPYAVGSAALAGFLVLYYMLSRGGGSPVGSGSSALAADAALGQAQAAAAIQTNAQQAAVQQANIAASSQNLQTSAAASVANTQTLAQLIASLYNGAQSTEVAQINANAETLQQANSETSTQNIYALEEGGLQAQVNAQQAEAANNNATSLAALVDQLNAQGTIASQAITAATGLATQSQTNFEKNVQLLAPTFGKQYNSALDANNAAAEIETVLAGGSPGVAATGIQSSATSVVSGNNSSAAKVGAIAGSISSGISSIVTGLFG